MRRTKRLLSMILALLLCLSMLPVSALAMDLPELDVLEDVVEAVETAESEEIETDEETSTETEQSIPTEDSVEAETPKENAEEMIDSSVGAEEELSVAEEGQESKTLLGASATYPIYIESLEQTDSARYTGNKGDSFIGVIGTRNGTTGVSGNIYEHGLELWVARWNFKLESSWVWAEYDVSEYTQDGCNLTGFIDVANNCANKTTYNTQVNILGDGSVLYSVILTSDTAYPLEFSVDLTGVATLRIDVEDNESAKAGTSFLMGDLRIIEGNEMDDYLCMDKWSFSNSPEYYGDTSKGYEITTSDYNRLTKNLWPTEIQAIDKKLNSKWGGSCYGMSAWVSLVSAGEKKAVQVAGKNALSMYECAESVESAINYYQVQTSLSSYMDSQFVFSHIPQSTQLDTITQLANNAYANGGVVIDFAWYETFNQDGTINYIDPHAHAVVGYGVETGDYTQLVAEYLAEKGRSCSQDIDFSKRILIYDCAYPDGGERYHLYYSDNGVWCIPGRGIISTHSGIADSIWNNGVLQLATADSALLNYIDFCSGERNRNFPFPDTSGYISLTSDAPEYSISWYNDTAKINGFTVTESTSDENITVVVSPNITADGNSTEATTTAFIPLADAYTIKSDDNLNFQLLNNDCLTIVETDSAGSVQMHATGGAAVQTEKSANYNISITDNNGCVNSQWHTIQISGSNATKISAIPKGDGVEILGDNLSDVSIRGENADDIVEVFFSTDESSALLAESNGTLTVYVDKDKDGVYDTELVLTSGDINNDGKINVEDLVRLMKHIVGAETAANKDALDVNGDNKVNILDIIRLIRYLAGENIQLY